MAVRIGIPRALLFYSYFPVWETFFRELGAEVVVSGPSTKADLDRGVKLAVEDACLPVKLAFGHIYGLAGKVDFLFLPRLVSTARREYICPKFLGFPDMVRQTVPGLPPIIDVKVDLYRKKSSLYSVAGEAGSVLGAGAARVFYALCRALEAFRRYRRFLEEGYLPEEAMALIPSKGKGSRVAQLPPGGEKELAVAVVGHPYNIYDGYISMNLVKRLESAGVRVVTADNLPEQVVRAEAARLPKKMFWTLNLRMTGAAFHFLRAGRVQGLLTVTSFGCGPDSLTGELIARRARAAGTVPFLNLVLDEHTGEAGVLTRLEAFLDMVFTHRCNSALSRGSVL
ncbi:MAG: acyl-CoA dehydratase activase-related protein [Desulfotomaculales bacterium]